MRVKMDDYLVEASKITAIRKDNVNAVEDGKANNGGA
jgi:hypothetical protein